MPLTLPPAQNADPAPVISSTCTSGFSPQSLIMLRSAGVSVSDSALRTSGRLSVMMATRSRIAHSSSSVPVSILVSAVVIAELLQGAGVSAYKPRIPWIFGRHRNLASSARSRMTIRRLLRPDRSPAAEVLLTYSVQQGNPYRKDGGRRSLMPPMWAHTATIASVHRAVVEPDELNRIGDTACRVVPRRQSRLRNTG